MQVKTIRLKESQDAFMRQVGSLKRLNDMDFETGHEEGDAYGFAPEKSLDLFGSMPHLEEVNLGVKASRRLTTEHADHISKMWPKLKTLYGVSVVENAAFVNYMKEHHPEVKVKRYYYEF